MGMLSNAFSFQHAMLEATAQGLTDECWWTSTLVQYIVGACSMVTTAAWQSEPFTSIALGAIVAISPSKGVLGRDVASRRQVDKQTFSGEGGGGDFLMTTLRNILISQEHYCTCMGFSPFTEGVTMDMWKGLGPVLFMVQPIEDIKEIHS